MFVTGKLFQPSLMFAGKAKAYLSGAHFRHSTHRQAPGFIRLGWEGLIETKQSNLLGTQVNYGRKKFYNIGPRSLVRLAQTYILCLVLSLRAGPNVKNFLRP